MGTFNILVLHPMQLLLTQLVFYTIITWQGHLKKIVILFGPQDVGYNERIAHIRRENCWICGF